MIKAAVGGASGRFLSPCSQKDFPRVECLAVTVRWVEPKGDILTEKLCAHFIGAAVIADGITDATKKATTADISSLDWRRRVAAHILGITAQVRSAADVVNSGRSNMSMQENVPDRLKSLEDIEKMITAALNNAGLQAYMGATLSSVDVAWPIAYVKLSRTRHLYCLTEYEQLSNSFSVSSRLILFLSQNMWWLTGHVYCLVLKMCQFYTEMHSLKIACDNATCLASTAQSLCLAGI